MKAVIREDECIGCTKCAQRCPSDAIEFKPYEIHSIDLEKCIKCDICRQVCPVDAIRIKEELGEKTHFFEFKGTR